MTAGRLHPDDLAEIVQAVTAEITARIMGTASTGTTRYCDTRTAAKTLNVSESYVREHAHELGAVRLGNGPRARLRFDLDALTQGLPAGTPDPNPAPGAAPRPAHQAPRAPARTTSDVELLPVNQPAVPKRSPGSAA